MTHLSPFSYIDRLLTSVLLFIFIFVYCFVIGSGVQDLQLDKLKSYNFKAVVALLLLIALSFSIASDSITTDIKYHEGYFDTCVIACEQSVENQPYNCTHAPSQDCEGILPTPQSEFSDTNHAVMVPLANALFNVCNMFRSNALFLLLVGFHNALRNVFPDPRAKRYEFRLYVAYTLFAFPMYFILQFAVTDDISLSTVLPQLFYSAEVLLLICLFIYTNVKITEVLQALPRNYISPRASEATLLYVRWMNWLLVMCLLLDIVGLAGINIDYLVHKYKSVEAVWQTHTMLLMDVFTKMYNISFFLTPLLATLVNYRPSVLLQIQFSRQKRLTQHSQMGTSQSPRPRMKPSLGESRPPNHLYIEKQSDQPVVTGTSRNSTGLPNKVLVSEKLGSQTEYLLNALLQVDETPEIVKRQSWTKKRNFVPLSQAIHEEDEEYDWRLMHSDSEEKGSRRLSSIYSTMHEADSDDQSQENTAADHEIALCMNENKHQHDEEDEDDEESGDRYREYVLTSEVQDEERQSAENKTILEKDFSNGGTQIKEVSSARSAPVEVELTTKARPRRQVSFKPEILETTGSLTSKQELQAPRPPKLTLQTTFSRVELPRFGASNMASLMAKKEHDSEESSGDEPGAESPRTERTRFWQQSKATNPKYIASGRVYQHSESGNISLLKKVKRRLSKSNAKGSKRNHGFSLEGDMTDDRRFELAELWLIDALENREPKLHRVRGWPLKIYRFKHKRSWKMALYICIAVQMILLPFWEPVSTIGMTDAYLSEFPRYPIALGLDFCFVIIFLVDTLMTLYTYGARELQLVRCSLASLKRTRSTESILFHIRLGLGIVALLNILAAMIWRTSFRLDRYFRWTSVLFVSKSVRNVFGDLVWTFQYFMGVIATYCFVITVYGLLGTVVFDSDLYDLNRNEFWGNQTGDPSQMYRVDTFPWLALNLYVLTTLEGFPDLLWPAYDYRPFLSFIYWLSFVLITILFLQSIAVPLVYEPLQKRQRERLMAGKIAERKALVAAFEILDKEDRFYLTEDTVNELLRSFSSKEDARIIMKLLDEDEDGKIDLLEFFHIVDSIKLRIKIKADEVISPYVKFCSCTIHRRPFQIVKKTAFFRHFGNWFTIVLFLVLMLYRIIPLTILLTVMGFYIAYIAFETVIIALSGPVRSSLKSGKPFAVRTILLVAETLLFILYMTTDLPGFLSALQICMILNIYRVLQMIPTLGAIVFVCSKLKRILATILMIVLTIMYGYTIFGMDVFSKNEYTTHPSGTKSDFANFPHAFITVFQMMMGEQWNSLLYVNSVSVDRNWGWWFLSVGYFLSFNLLVNLYILSIILAIFLDAFLVFRNVKEDTVSEYVDKTKAAKVLGIPNRKYLLFKKRSLEETLYEDFLLQNQKNTIQELLDLGIIRNVGAIRQYTHVEGEDERPIFRLTRYGSSVRVPSPRGAIWTGKSSRLESPKTPGALAAFSTKRADSGRQLQEPNTTSTKTFTTGNGNTSKRRRRTTLGVGNQMSFEVSLSDVVHDQPQTHHMSHQLKKSRELNEDAIDNI